MFAPFSHSFPNLLLLASNRQGCWTRWTLELAVMAGSTLQTCQKTEEGRHSNKMWCFFPGALLLQQLATAGRTSSRAKRHLQGKTDRGYRVHQQPGATLRQKPTARMEPAVKCIPLALIIACSFFTLFIASIHSLSKW